MIEISKENHAKVLNASLNKIYNQARIKGRLEPIDLYIFNVLFKYLDGCNLDLTHEQQKKLECIYRILYNTSNNICKVNTVKGFKTTMKTKFVVGEGGAGGTGGNPGGGPGNGVPVTSKVFYWQEPTPFTEAIDIVDLIVNGNYLQDKPFVSKTEFEFEIEVPLTHIGRVCYAFDPSFASSQFLIKDFLGNDITHAFDKTIIPSKDIVLFSSELVHSYGTHKTSGVEVPGDPNANIFNNIFNNTFA